jgi:hypothetical protein
MSHCRRWRETSCQDQTEHKDGDLLYQPTGFGQEL